MKAISQFWSWWPEARPRIESAIVEGRFDGLTQEINERVEAIDASLDWELGPGVHGAQHAFCLSSKGDPDLRRVAERWRSSAPPADRTWEFHASREGRPENVSLELEIGGHRVAFGDLHARWEVDEARERIHAEYWHPRFSKMPEDLRKRVTFLALDSTLGEDGVERWLGAIEIVTRKPRAARPLAELIRATADLSSRATGERFALLRGEADGAPLFVTVNLALKRIDHLLCDMHVAVEVPLLAPDAHGLPTRDEARQLDELEDDLLSTLGEGAVYVGRETTRGKRTLHLYAPELGRAAQDLETWAARHGKARAIEITCRRDPEWEQLRRWS